MNHLTVSEIISREIEAGVALGPVHQKWLLERRGPEHVRRQLRLAAERPWLVGAQQGFASVDGPGAPPASFTAVNTTVTETNLWNPALWTPIGALDMKAGKLYKVSFGGVMGTTATPAVSFRARCGTNNSAPPTGVDLGVGATVTLGTFTAQPFYGEFTMAVRSLGVAASGATVTGNGFVVMPAAAAATVTPQAQMGGAVPTTVDHTVGQGIGISVIWGTSSASNTITAQWAVIRSYN